jgi:cytochrome P450
MLLSTIATVDHDLHRSRRKLTENFFSKQFIYRFSHMVDAKVQKLMQRLEGFYKSGKVVQMDDAFSALTSDVITHYCYGKSWDYLDDENLRNDVRKAVGDITGIIHVNRIFPIFISTIRKLPLSLFYLLQPGKRGLLDMQKAIYEQSNQAIQKDEPSENKRKTIYDQLTDPSVPLEERSLQRLQDEGLLLLSAGTETTARALTMASFHIANDAEVRNQLRAELKRVMPTPTSTVTWTELEKLPYLVC